MTLLSLLATFMLSIGSPAFIIHDITSEQDTTEVDIQTVSLAHPQRYLLVILHNQIIYRMNLPLEGTQCQSSS
jgi:hypothetical protein